MIRKYFVLVLCMVVSYSSFGQTVDDAETMLKDTVNSVLTTLKNKELDKESRHMQLIEVFDKAFKFELMAKLSFGRSWTTLTKEQQTEFSELFVTRLKDSYMEKLALYSEESVIFEQSEKRKRGHLYVPTFVLSNGDRISMVYKMFKSDGIWFIYDIEIQGVSVISTYRSQYAQLLKEGSFKELIESMKAVESTE